MVKMVNIQEDLREKLKEIRRDYGTTYSFIAKEIGVNRAIISMLISGSRGLSLTNEIKLRQYIAEKFPNKED
jgi:transcriptional regulator with XRE-family HTH domain